MSSYPVIYFTGKYHAIKHFLLVVVLTTTVLFNWQFSVHRWPDMPFFVACCIGVLLMFATIFPVALCLAEWFHLETYELLEVFFDIAPEAIIILLIAIPANLIIWKWIFNKPDNK